MGHSAEVVGCIVAGMGYLSAWSWPRLSAAGAHPPEWAHDDEIRGATLVAADGLARVPRRGTRGRGQWLGLGMDVGSPAGHLWAMGAADFRRLVDADGRRRGHQADPTRVDGWCQYVPQSRPDRQARDDPRPCQRRPGGPRDRRRLVRAGTRGLRVSRVWRQRWRAAGSSG